MEAGFYDNLNEHDPIRLPLNIDGLAAAVITANYGVHRFCSALVRQAKLVEKRSELIDAIEKLLDDGSY